MSNASYQAPDQHVADLLSSHELFKNLEPAAFKDLLFELEIVHLRQGEFLLRQGDPGDSVFILVDGRLSVEMDAPDGARSLLEEIEPGGMIGEIALLTGQARAANVRALDDCQLVKISRDDVDRLVARHPQVMSELARILLPRLQRTHLSGILKDAFAGMDLAGFQELQAGLDWRHHAGGEVVYEQGQAGEAMVIVVNGRLKLVRHGADGSEQVVGEFHRGSFLGGYVLLTGEPYRERAVAVRDTDVVLLSQQVFQDLLQRHPGAVLHIARQFVQQQSVQGVSREASRDISLALVPCSPGVRMGEFAQGLAAALKGMGTTLHLSSARFDTLYGKPNASQTSSGDAINTSIVAWLSDKEASCNYVLYEADPTWTPWTRRCLRQADRIVLVADGEAEPVLGEIEEVMRQAPTGARQELVILHPSQISQPTGTRKWLERRQVHHHHHVRIEHEADMRRAARQLTGRATGLVLSGGAARGIAHLGVYKALVESGVEIDIFGGTSMGALAAGIMPLYAQVEDLERLAEEYFSAKKLHDRTLPVTAIFATRKITEVLQKLFGEVQIEDLWRPFFCISANLSRSEVVVHRSGDAWKAVRASIAIPGVFSPLCMDGDILVDGGVMNNLPVDVMRQECEGGTVIAVNANPAKESHRAWDFGPSISGWEVLWSRINPFTKRMRVPILLETVARATVMNSRMLLRSVVEQADVVIEPETGAFASMDWSAFRDIEEAGYRAGKNVLSNLSL